jgi:hypothetical protein
MANVIDHQKIVNRNCDWFINSGVMRPNDGFWGVGERICAPAGEKVTERIRQSFFCQTPLPGGACALEHRRADCNYEAAYLFRLAGEAFNKPEYLKISDNIIDFMVDRSGLERSARGDARQGLWRWWSPFFRDPYYIDDNAWCCVMAMKLAQMGRPEQRDKAIMSAQLMHRHCRPYVEHFVRHGLETPYEYPKEGGVLGLMLEPHFIGLTCMAFAHAARFDETLPYRQLAEAYCSIILNGPPASDRKRLCGAISTGLPWTMSEYAYLALSASIAAEGFNSDSIRQVALRAADILIDHQEESGHLRSEHFETPPGRHLCDLIYTDNWAVLAYYHVWLLSGKQPKYRAAFDKLLGLLAGIQDASGDVCFDGCWRGLYDTLARQWGGGDCYEGGQSSAYTGWTNAPISWAFLFDLTGKSLFAHDSA